MTYASPPLNGRKLVDGTLRNVSFHIGSEANETISVSIADMRATGLGNNSVSTNNTANGIETATGQNVVSADGSTIGLAVNGADNGVAAQTLTVLDADGVEQEVSVAANETAETTAGKLAALDGVDATAATSVTLFRLNKNGSCR